MDKRKNVAALTRRSSVRPTRGVKVGPSLRDLAYKTIKHRITTCFYPPGNYLNEANISATIGIGRTPVHQAIDRLVNDGMVVVIPRKGVIVKPVSLDEILQIIEVRVINECYCARLVAEQISDDEVQSLTNILVRAQQAAAAKNTEQMMLLDGEFHEALAKASRRGVLAETLGRLHDRSLRFWFISLNAPGYHAAVQEQHEAILSAIRKRDPDQAEKAMRAHIDAFRANIIRQV